MLKIVLTVDNAPQERLDNAQLDTEHTPGSVNDGPKWDIEETPGKFEFVRWENA